MCRPVFGKLCRESQSGGSRREYDCCQERKRGRRRVARSLFPREPPTAAKVASRASAKTLPSATPNGRCEAPGCGTAPYTGARWVPSRRRRLAPVSGRKGHGLPGRPWRSAVAPRTPPRPHDEGAALCFGGAPWNASGPPSLPHDAGPRVELAGWLHRFRQLSRVSFLILRDGRGLAQVVVEEPALVERLAGLPNETVLRVVGEAVANPQAPGGIEVRASSVEVVSVPAEPPPFDLYRPTLNAQLPTILDHAAVALRHPRQRALFRIASASAAGYRAALTVARLRRDLHAEDRRLGDRGRRQRLRHRLLRPRGVPGPEPAVLQADHGRRLRAGLRGRPGLPRRAPRHAAPPEPVRLARLRDGVHPGPHDGDGRPRPTCSGRCSQAIREQAADAVALLDLNAARGARRDPVDPLRRRPSA